METAGRWDADPVAIALEASIRSRDRKGRDEPPSAPGGCLEIGRRLLLAQLQFSDWTLRRVEKVRLERDHSLSRKITVEFAVRDDAPTFIGAGGRTMRLVPISMMRRRTLVNLSIRDERGDTLTMPGIRLCQQLDESITLAAIAAGHPETAAGEECRRWVHQAISGDLSQVLQAYDAFDHAPEGTFLRTLRDDDLVTATVNRFRTSFTLYVLLQERPPDRRTDRMITLSFEEPIDWRYQTPEPLRPGDDQCCHYQPGRPGRLSLRRGLAALGIAPIRLRLQVPGAENAASYHFEMTTPPGVSIVRATLLAGRPNIAAPAPQTIDRVTGHVTTVGLHGLEIPRMSLCRVQVDLRATARGWLSTVFVACLAISAVLGTVAFQWCGHGGGALTWELISNVVLLLVTTSAGVTALVAQSTRNEVAARFVTGARALGTIATALPLAAAGVLVYVGPEPDGPRLGAERGALLGLCGVSVIPLAVIAIATARSVFADTRLLLRESPWDMTDHQRARELGRHRPVPNATYQEHVRNLRFDSAAVGVRSAESWHDFYTWTDAKQQAATRALSRSLHDCPSRRRPGRSSDGGGPPGSPPVG